jgi:hypothetical protein
MDGNPVSQQERQRISMLGVMVFAMSRPVPAVLLSVVAAVSMTACSARSGYFVSSPAPNGVMLAPDLPTLSTLFSSNPPESNNTITVPNGTNGEILDRKFLKGGRLVTPYPASQNQMERDGAIEVALFEVTEGPQRGAKGWVQASFLRTVFTLL